MTRKSSVSLVKLLTRKQNIMLSVALGAVVGLALAGHYWWTEGRYYVATNNAYVRGEITPISAKVAGYVTALQVEDNQPVKAGDVLLRIEQQEYQLAVEEAAARVAEARAALANIDARIELQATLIEQAAAGVAAAEAERDRADKEWQRARALLARKTGTQRTYDLAEADQRRAAALVQRRRAEHRQAQQQVMVLKSERQRLTAILAQSQAEEALARMRLNDTVVRAPVSGVVGNRSVHRGQYVQPGALLMAIMPLEHVWVEANFKETQLTHMKVGQKVTIEIDTYPDHVLTGHVDSFSPASGAEFSLLPPENATGNFTKLVQRIPVKIVLDRSDDLVGALRPGMSAQVVVDTRPVRSEPVLAKGAQ